MKKRSASSRSAARATTKKRSTSTRTNGAAEVPMITAEELDRRPGREVQRVNVDFPMDLLRAIDQEAKRIGVTRQAFIKLRIADTLTTR